MLFCALLSSSWVLKNGKIIIYNKHNILFFPSHNVNSAIKVLKASVFKNRQQKNAITAMGHFFTLIVQTGMFGTLVFFHCFNQEDSGVAFW